MTTITRQGRALVVKEWRVLRRGSWLLIALAIPYGVFLEWFVLRNAALALGSGRAALGVVAATTLAIVPALLIPFVAGNAIARALVDDRARQSLVPLFATGVPPWLCWSARVSVAFALGYAAALASLLFDLALVRWWFRAPLPVTWRLAAVALVVAPALALGVIALVSTVQWAAPRLAPAATFIPFIALMLGWSRLSEHPPSALPAGGLAALALGALGATAACVALVARLGHGRLAGG